jgi:hypothetical protein
VIGAAAGGAALRVTVPLLLLCFVASILCGCGATARDTIELRLERADLRTITSQLSAVQRGLSAEVAASRQAWPSLYNGLPEPPPKRLQAEVARAQAALARVAAPAFLNEARGLTGPASDIGSLFEVFWALDHQGWTAIAATIQSIRDGPASAAGFRRANVPIYIQSVYDAHYDLSLIANSIKQGYEALGEAQAFATLTPVQINALSDLYSPSGARLEPHTSNRLGL